jgi:hypothetical protein
VAKVFDGIDDRLREWIGRQHLFFVATSPLDGDGHVNLSPKGPIESLAVVDDHTVAYLDVTGSGAETIAHLRENGRIVVMLCAFEGPPRIVRLHGRGTVVHSTDPGFAEWAERCAFTDPPLGYRSIIVVDVKRVADSCGYGVPLMSYEGQRPHQQLSAEKRLRTKGPNGFAEYQRERNAESIDGLPAVEI